MSQKPLHFVLKLAVSILLIGFITWKFDLSSFYLRLTNLKTGYVLFAIIVLVIVQFNNTARWRAVLNTIEAKLSFWTSFRLLYIGVFFNLTLPKYPCELLISLGVSPSSVPPWYTFSRILL